MTPAQSQGAFMPTFSFFGYAAAVLPYDEATNSFTFASDYDFTQDRIRIDVTDDDTFFDGDRSNDELGEDANQTGVVTTPGGAPVASGRIYVEAYGQLRDPDGNFVFIDRIEVEGLHVGYSVSAPLVPGTTYTVTLTDNVDDRMPRDTEDRPDGGPEAEPDADTFDNRMQYSQYQAQSVPCFGPGTMIATRQGEQPVEWLEAGVEVITRDHGFKPLRAVLRRTVEAAWFNDQTRQWPVVFAPGGLGPRTPMDGLILTGNHRVLLQSASAELLFGEAEVLVAAKEWERCGAARQWAPDGPIELTHLVFEAHEIIMAEGVWVESYFSGPGCGAQLPALQRDILRRALGFGMGRHRAARRCLSSWEARLVLPGAPSISAVRRRRA